MEVELERGGTESDILLAKQLSSPDKRPPCECKVSPCLLIALLRYAVADGDNPGLIVDRAALDYLPNEAGIYEDPGLLPA